MLKIYNQLINGISNALLESFNKIDLNDQFVFVDFNKYISTNIFIKDYKIFDVTGFCKNVSLGVNDIKLSFKFNGLAIVTDRYKGTTYYHILFLIDNQIVKYKVRPEDNDNQAYILSIWITQFAHLYVSGNIYNCDVKAIKKMCRWYLKNQTDDFDLDEFKKTNIMKVLNKNKQPEMDMIEEEKIQQKNKENEICKMLYNDFELMKRFQLSCDKYIENISGHTEIYDIDIDIKGSGVLVLNNHMYDDDDDYYYCRQQPTYKIWYPSSNKQPLIIQNIFNWFKEHNLGLGAILIY